jgi:hypothetical protein
MEPVELTVDQGDELIVTFEVDDVEGDGIELKSDNPLVEVDLEDGEVRWTPGNEDVGELTFHLMLSDTVEPDSITTLNLSVVVHNVNDEMDNPVILSPSDSARFKHNESVTFEGSCHDPDTMHGQVLNYSWSSNISGHLGYGSNLEGRFLEAGIHEITLTVSDDDFRKSVSIEIIIDTPEENDPNGGGEVSDESSGLIPFLIVIIVVSIGAVSLLRRLRLA